MGTFKRGARGKGKQAGELIIRRAKEDLSGVHFPRGARARASPTLLLIIPAALSGSLRADRVGVSWRLNITTTKHTYGRYHGQAAAMGVPWTRVKQDKEPERERRDRAVERYGWKESRWMMVVVVVMARWRYRTVPKLRQVTTAVNPRRDSGISHTEYPRRTR